MDVCDCDQIGVVITHMSLTCYHVFKMYAFKIHSSSYLKNNHNTTRIDFFQVTIICTTCPTFPILLPILSAFIKLLFYCLRILYTNIICFGQIHSLIHPLQLPLHLSTLQHHIPLPTSYNSFLPFQVLLVLPVHAQE